MLTTQQFYISSQRGKSKTFLYELKFKENEQRVEKSLLTQWTIIFNHYAKQYLEFKSDNKIL